MPSPSNAAAARRRVASQLTNISTCVPAPTVNSPNAALASNSMTSNAPSSVDISLGNVSSNPSTTTTTIIIPTWGPTLSAMPTVILGNTNQTTGMCMSAPTCTLTIGSAISKPDQIESMHTDIASNVAQC